ncbi:MAG: Grx4 family monothiol glutaredoxin [Endozoicomonadaceae bacterium]|nr:Grx4 family monothiol glutaredoxin [Endozoicomonadaceae bacterium]
MDILENIKKQIKDNPILLYMKGSPDIPQCGFSKSVVDALITCNIPFSFVDVLHPDIRADLRHYANWPTFPQLWVKGELIGGHDIVIDLFSKGELQPLLKTASDSLTTH